MRLKTWYPNAEVECQYQCLNWPRISMIKAYPEVVWDHPRAAKHFHYVGPDGVPSMCAWVISEVAVRCPYEGMVIFEN